MESCKLQPEVSRRLDRLFNDVEGQRMQGALALSQCHGGGYINALVDHCGGAYSGTDYMAHMVCIAVCHLSQIHGTALWQ